MTDPRPKRKAIPLGVKLAAALIALGMDPDDVEWDHDPAIGMRPINPETGDTIPPANDPRAIVPRLGAAHKAKTFGDHRPLSGDVSQIAKIKRVDRKHEEFRQRLLAKATGEPVAAPTKHKGPAIPSRPFPKRKKPWTT